MTPRSNLTRVAQRLVPLESLTATKMRLARRHGGSNAAGGLQAFSEMFQLSRHTAGRQLSVASLIECRGETCTGGAWSTVCSAVLCFEKLL